MSDELPAIEPEVLSGVPFCSDNCPQHDGKRCRLLGLKPGNICEPGVDRIIADRNRLQNHVPGLTATLDELRQENARLREALTEEQKLTAVTAEWHMREKALADRLREELAHAERALRVAQTEAQYFRERCDEQP